MSKQSSISKAKCLRVEVPATCTMNPQHQVSNYVLLQTQPASPLLLPKTPLLCHPTHAAPKTTSPRHITPNRALPQRNPVGNSTCFTCLGHWSRQMQQVLLLAGLDNHAAAV